MTMLQWFKRFMSGELAADGAAMRYRLAADEVGQLSLEDAQRLAFEALNDPDVNEEFEPGRPMPSLPFSDMTAGFLAEHRHFESVRDGMKVDVSEAERWNAHPEFIVIGVSSDGHSMLLVRESGDAVYETDGTEGINDMLRYGLPTIFHWLALCHRNREI